MSDPCTEHVKPVAIDDYCDVPGGFVQEWMVPPPPEGQAYRAVREEWFALWESGMWVRRVWEWEPARRLPGMSPLEFMRMPRWRRRLNRLISLLADGRG